MSVRRVSLYAKNPNPNPELLKYTISIFSENEVGIMNKITIAFTRRRINIESLTVSESEEKGIHRFTIVVYATELTVIKLIKQIQKLVGVFYAFYHSEEETIFQEIALYKMPTSNLVNDNRIETLLRHHFARIISVEKEFFIIEKTGHKDETSKLREELLQYGLLEFTRSGRVAITRPMKKFSQYMAELDAENDYHPDHDVDIKAVIIK